MADLNIKGLKGLYERLDEVARLKGLQKGLTIATARVEGTAKDLCPVDDGTLRASITSKVEGEVGIVGTNVEYAPYVEFGTSKMGAQPYLFPALELERDNVAKDIADALREELK